MSKGLIRPYYYGEHSWDDYLLDIHESIEASNVLQKRNLQGQSAIIEWLAQDARVAAGHREEQREQLGQLLTTLQQIQYDLCWGFGLIVDRMDQQIQVFSQAVAKLDAIDKTLRIPLRTQAKELFDRGNDLFRKKLLEEALEAFTQAEQKHKTDPFTQLRIGMLRLEGRDDYCNLIDLPQAEQHFLLAARYAQAEEGTLPNWNEFCGRALYHAAQAAYLVGEKKQDDRDAMRSCLERALEQLSKASRICPGITDLLYRQAKCLALVGHKQQALEKIELLSDRDRRYFPILLLDRDLGAIQDEIKAVFRKALESPGSNAREADSLLMEANDAFTWADRSLSGPASDIETSASIGEHERLQFAREFLKAASHNLRGYDVSIEGLVPQLRTLCAELESVADRVLRERIKLLEDKIAGLKEQRGRALKSLDYLRERARETKGSSGIGWLFVGLFYFALIVFLYDVWWSIIRFAQKQNFFPALMFFGYLFVGYWVGKGISKYYRNSSLRRQVRDTSHEINELDRNNPVLIKEAESDLSALREQLDRFLAWSRNKRASRASTA